VFAAAARTDRSLIFTFAPEASVHVGFPSRTLSLVEAEGGRVYFVRLVVSEREQELRIGSQSRKQFHKLTDLTTLRELRNYRDDVEQPPVDLEVDTNTSTAEESAALIVERFRLTPQKRPERYPQRG